jgi:hypothetical protein
MFDYTYDRDVVISALGVEAADEEFKEHVLKRIDELLDMRIGMIIQDELTDEEVVELDKLGNDRQKASEWLAKRFPNHEQMYEQALNEIVSELKTSLAQ